MYSGEIIETINEFSIKGDLRETQFFGGRTSFKVYGIFDHFSRTYEIPKF